MQLYQLEYFIKVVECGSITKAAQELYLSQPSLTKAIAKLEEEYDIQLLNRMAKGIQLTTKGQEFLEYALNAVESCNALERSFGKKYNPSIQWLTIASQQFDFVYDILLRIYQEHSQQPIHIDFKESDRGEIIDMVEKRKVDIGLLVLTEEDTKMFKSELKSKDLEVHTLDKSSVYVSMGKNSPLYKKDNINTSDSKSYLHVVLDTEQTSRRELRYRTLHDSINHEHLVFCNTIGLCLQFLEKSDALLYTPKWVLGLLKDTDIRSVQLKVDGSNYPLVNRLVWIKRANEKLNRLEERFMELVKANFARE